MKNYPDVDMFKDYNGTPFFQADCCGDMRFKTAKAAQQACNDAREQRRLTDRAKSLSALSRVEIDVPQLEARLFKDGQLVRTQEIKDVRHARMMVFDLLDEVKANDVVWF